MTGDSSFALKQQAKRSAFWSLVEKMGIQFLSALVGIIMTRLLLPSDYGLIAMLDIFIAAGLLIADFGLGQGFIRNRDAHTEDQSLILFCNTGIGLVIYLGMVAASGLIGRFYGEPQLVSIIRVFALNIPIQGFGMIYQSKLMKDLRLHILTKTKLFSLVLSGAIGVYLSIKGFGAWAIVYYITSFNVSNAIILFFVSGWFPRLDFNFKNIKIYYSYSIRLLGASLLDAFYTNFFTMFIGKVYKSGMGGLYSKSRLIQNIPVMSAVQIIQAVSFPVFTKVQNEDEKLLPLFARQIRVISFLMSFIIGIMVLTAKPFVHIILTDKWIDMVPFFQLLLLLGWILPFQTLHSSLLNAKGRSDVSLRLEVAKKTLAIAGLLVVFKLGVIAIIIAQIVAGLLGLLLHIFYTKKYVGYKLWKQMKDLMIPPAIMTGIVLILFNVLHGISNYFYAFGLQLISFSCIYLIAASIARRNEISFLKGLIMAGIGKKNIDEKNIDEENS
jgi:O-antigen/teichoic acid export membrane protein